VMIGASSGGTGGPALGYLVTLPLMATSLVAGYIYSGGPRLPWLVSLGLVLVTLAVSLAYLRDPHQAEA
ncbi:MAG: hypothetical protein GXY68_10270, partial [Chloroflexi bacterium]|nr:hypothetical protein [Chloroflexota bacterium]